MKKLFQTIALLAVLAVMSAPAWSATYNDHVSLAPNGKGDVLIYPMYIGSDGGYQTKIQVMNTSDQMSAVVKVVLRSPVYSQECRDFFLFLSPTDMWEGIILYQDGETVLVTDDDSFLTSDAPTFASQENPYTLDTINPGCDDMCNFGYAEAFLSWVSPELSAIPTEKEDIFDAYIGTGDLATPNPQTGFFPGAPRLGDPDPNVIAGNLEVQNTLQGWSAALNATTLKDYGNTAALNPAVETVFGQNSQNSMDEVEAALNKDNIGFPYINNDDGNSMLLVNFPTKLTNLDTTDCSVTGTRGNYTGFDLNGTEEDSVVYSLRRMDMMENHTEAPGDVFSPVPEEGASAFPGEINAIIASAYEKGWYRVRFTEGATVGTTQDTLFGNIAGDYLRYAGAPAIPLALNFGEAGLSLKYGVWDDGQVVGTDDGTAAGNERKISFQYARSTPTT